MVKYLGTVCTYHLSSTHLHVNLAKVLILISPTPSKLSICSFTKKWRNQWINLVKILPSPYSNYLLKLVSITAKHDLGFRDLFLSLKTEAS